MELRLSNKKDCARWSLLGILLLILGVLILVLDPAAFLVRVLLKMKEGSMAHDLWKKPPVDVYLYIYLYNITNGERFLKGQDKKLALQEIGPYVFKETRENINMTYNANGTMTFIPNITVEHIPELSVGDMKTDRVICINMPFMGIFSNNGNASLLKQLGLNLFAKTIDAQAILNLTVEELMWGYDDELVRLAAGYFPEWISFDRFGIIDRMYADKDNIVTMDLNEAHDKLYTIEKWNGVSGLEVWGYNGENTSLSCNNFEGTYEGLLFPTNLAEGSNVKVYKKIFCRTLRLYHKKTITMDSGLLGYSYELPYSALSCKNPENVCYCPDDGPCLPDGFSDVSPCYYGLPVAISLPHFLGASETLSERFHGISANETKHMSTIIIQPNIGMPMKVSSKIQLNLVINNVKFNNQLRPFSGMIVPVLWMDARVENLPKDLELKILLVFKYLPYLQKIISWIMIIIGIVLFVYKSVMYLFVTIKAAQTKNQPSLNYIPVSTNEPFDNKKEKEILTYD